MKYYGKRSLSTALKVILDILMIIGFLLTISIFITTYFKDTNLLSIPQKLVIFLLLVIGISCLFMIVLGLRKILISLENGDPFIDENVSVLKGISYKCFIVGGTYIINYLYNAGVSEFQFIYVDNNGIHTDMEFLIFIFGGIFIYILSKVFQKAVEYKKENDFTV